MKIQKKKFSLLDFHLALNGLRALSYIQTFYARDLDIDYKINIYMVVYIESSQPLRQACKTSGQSPNSGYLVYLKQKKCTEDRD